LKRWRRRSCLLPFFFSTSVVSDPEILKDTSGKDLGYCEETINNSKQFWHISVYVPGFIPAALYWKK
jgi:hypothetical protein